MNAFRSSFADFNNAETIILNPSIPEIVFRGLKTLKVLIPDKFKETPANANYSNPVTTIVKSRMFQGSLK